MRPEPRLPLSSGPSSRSSSRGRYLRWGAAAGGALGLLFVAGVLSLVWGECQNCLAEALLGGAGHLLGGVVLGTLVGYGLWLLRQRGRGA